MDNKNNQNQEGQQLQIDLSPEIAKGVYTNFQIISHSSSEFRYKQEFGEIGPRKSDNGPRTIAPFGNGKVEA